ncbi:MAG TPA: hypothetical protein VFQ53_07735 [Kofleriaceae bacterium]|nr:hypothetical protein [Kofleriaceae bacterium]
MASPKVQIVRDEPKPELRLPEPSGTSVQRYEAGWRSGKPIEDPEKLKSWGWVGAKPSEYLVCTRGGTIARRRSGQGVRIFKWPWESVAIVPTTLQRIEFVADQITREKIGVEVAGIAVYRIAEPELAFRVLNFTYGEAAAEKLAQTLREMFVGAARRLVANLSLDECLTRRKETIAHFLMEEIRPVVSGEGSPEDTTATGWGVVIDTIEIQQVIIQSPQVFAHLQAPFRAEIAARAELADLERARQVSERRAETERRTQEAELETLRATRALKARTEAEATEVETREAARRAEMQAAAEIARLEADAARVATAHRAALRELEHQQAMRRQQEEAELESQRRAAEARDAENQLDVAHQRRLVELEQLVAASRIQRELVAALPQIATALAPHAETLHVTQIGDGSAVTSVPSAIAQLVAIARSFGLELPRRDPDA